MKKFFKNPGVLKTLYVIFPIVLLIIALLVKSNLSFVRSFLPECYFKAHTGLDCPACGNTRSVIALLNLDILGALKANITPVTLLIVIILFYIEIGFALFKRKIKLLPRTLWFWIPLFAVYLLYYIFRNAVYFVH